MRELDVAPGLAGELLGDRERLREEALDLARARNDHLVVVRELLHAEDRDDVLQVLVPLEDELHVARGAVVLGAEHVGVEDARRRGQRVDRRIDPELRERT